LSRYYINISTFNQENFNFSRCCSGNALYTCTPGYPSTGITPASTFGPFLTQTYVPGTCNNYDFARYKYCQVQCSFLTPIYVPGTCNNYDFARYKSTTILSGTVFRPHPDLITLAIVTTINLPGVPSSHRLMFLALVTI
jgi:hypothetical protein